MRKPLVIELVDGKTGNVEWSGSYQEMNEANYDCSDVLDAVAEIVIAYRMDRPLPEFDIGGGAAPVFIIRGKGGKV